MHKRGVSDFADAPFCLVWHELPALVKVRRGRAGDGLAVFVGVSDHAGICIFIRAGFRVSVCTVIALISMRKR